MSSNLPPGITEGMLPGNRSEDAERERWLEHMADEGAKIVAGTDPLRALYQVIEFVRCDVAVDYVLGDAFDLKLQDIQLALEERWADDSA